MNIDIPAKVRFEGYFILVKHQCDEQGEIIPGTAQHVAEFPNLITDTGLDMIGLGLDYATCQVGSGATAPSFTDTSLVARIASVNLNTQTNTYVVGPPEYGQTLRTYRFAAGVAAGNLSEIGVSGGTVTPLYSRALILDGTGTPTTISIGATEALDCTYICRMIIPPTDATGSANVSVLGNAVTYNWTCRPSNVGTWQNCLSSSSGLNPGQAVACYDGAIGARAAQPAGNQSAGSLAIGSYSNSSHTRGFTANFDLTHGNFGNGITAFSMTTFGIWQFGINGGANIPKTSNQTLAVTFNFSWTR